MVKAPTPVVTISCAMSFDGKIAAVGKKLALSDKKDWVRQYIDRGSHDALLIGANSVGNYSYSSRGHGKEPVKVILDSSLKTKTSAKIFKTPATGKKSNPHKQRLDVIIFHTEKASRSRIAAYKKMQNVKLVEINPKITPKKALQVLGNFGIQSVLVEGGGKTIHSFLSSGCFDKIKMFVSPQILGGNENQAVNFASGNLLWPCVKLKITRVYKQGMGFVVEARKA